MTSLRSKPAPLGCLQFDSSPRHGVGLVLRGPRQVAEAVAEGGVGIRHDSQSVAVHLVGASVLAGNEEERNLDSKSNADDDHHDRAFAVCRHEVGQQLHDEKVPDEAKWFQHETLPYHPPAADSKCAGIR